MNRAELVDSISNLTSQPKVDCDRFLSAFIETVEQNISKDDGVKLVGFGSFSIAERKARVGRNPRTGQEVKIPARHVPVFKVGSALKEAAMKPL